jgi:hypothetical protein
MPKSDQDNSNGDNGLQFYLELNPAVATGKPIPVIVLPVKQEEKKEIGKTEPALEKQAVDALSNFGLNLQIPVNFLDSSPAQSPFKKGKLHLELEQGKYDNFLDFLKTGLCPELENLINIQEQERYERYFYIEAKRNEAQHPKNESQLVELNYEMLLELYEIAEQMIEIGESHEDNVFLKECKDFIEKHNEILNNSIAKAPNKTQEQFYRLLKADEVLIKLFEALQETLVAMEKSTNVESFKNSEAEPLPPYDHSVLLALYSNYIKSEKENIFPPSDENVNDITSKFSSFKG